MQFIERKSKIVSSKPVPYSVAAAVAAILLTAAPPAQAQQTELDALRAEIAALQARLDKLEAAQKPAPTTGTGGTSASGTGTSGSVTNAPAAAAPVTAKVPVTLSGLLHVNARAYTGQKGPFANTPNTLQLRRGEIRLTAPITSRITGMIMIDPAKQTAVSSTSTLVPPKKGSPAGTPSTVTTTTTLNQSTNPLQEIVLAYQLGKNAVGMSPVTGAAAAKSANAIELGQYKIPIGFEGDVVSSSAIPTVDRALMFTARDPFGGGNGDIRETGVRLHGTAAGVDYNFGIYNGLGERQNALAAGNPKAFIGRVMYSPASVRGLAVGISGAQGNQRNTPAAGQQVQRDLLNAFVNYQRDKWTARTEYLTGSNQLFVKAPGTKRDIRGYYGLLGYSFTPKLEGVFRYDYFDFANNLVPAAGAQTDPTVKEIVLGLNYYIKGNNAKIQANIVRRHGGSGLVAANGFGSNATAFTNDSTQLRTNFQVAF
ncbi:MAG: outer membrane beta-barrel protein [Abitibacteriaceae bacterium]|nr:outer membrane beta-barrel protein [Abditibacteriaceae bacterium]MBV9865190.1 outer membrane beta-barrel protein [Abditibacteriaceae bacterium]